MLSRERSVGAIRCQQNRKVRKTTSPRGNKKPILDKRELNESIRPNPSCPIWEAPETNELRMIDQDQYKKGCRGRIGSPSALRCPEPGEEVAQGRKLNFLCPKHVPGQLKYFSPAPRHSDPPIPAPDQYLAPLTSSTSRLRRRAIATGWCSGFLVSSTCISSALTATVISSVSSASMTGRPSSSIL